MAGFDTCTAPSLPAMKAWRPNYAAVAIYIGGPEMACDYGNLSKGWVQSTEAMGWSLMPIFVGPQATCNSFSDEIIPGQAAAEGTQPPTRPVGRQPVRPGQGVADLLRHGGLRRDRLQLRDRGPHLPGRLGPAADRQGYVSGVYSSAASGVTDLQTTTTVAGHPLAEPQAIWFALWDNVLNLTGSPYVTSAVWPTPPAPSSTPGRRGEHRRVLRRHRL